MQTIDEEYFDWLLDCISNDPTETGSRIRLLRALYDKDFYYTIPMDDNRAADGIDLRYRFGLASNHEQAVIARYLDNRECSVLEMMVAFSMRIEDDIMTTPEGDTTYKWFWEMIESLGLYDMTNDIFDPIETDQILNKFLDRKYKRNGQGGLFTIKRSTQDMRQLELWSQMCLYFDGILF